MPPRPEKRRPLTGQRLDLFIDYDPSTGVFRWKVTRGKAISGAIAGFLDEDGARYIRIDGVMYFAHHLAWLYMHGRWPEQDIDHRDGDPDNNAITNLRLASHSQNMANQGRRSDNTSGFKGVSFDSRKKRWRAYIRPGNRQKSLGHFDSPELAHAAYVAAAQEIYGEFANAGHQPARGTLTGTHGKGRRLPP